MMLYYVMFLDVHWEKLLADDTDDDTDTAAADND